MPLMFSLFPILPCVLVYVESLRALRVAILNLRACTKGISDCNDMPVLLLLIACFLGLLSSNHAM
jgi:hypothetical protein